MSTKPNLLAFEVTETTSTEKSAQVNGLRILQLLKEGKGPLHQWDRGFFCLSPQPANYACGDAPKEPWIGPSMFQQMVAMGVLSSTGSLTRGDIPQGFRTKNEDEFIKAQSQAVRSQHTRVPQH